MKNAGVVNVTPRARTAVPASSPVGVGQSASRASPAPIAPNAPAANGSGETGHYANAIRPTTTTAP